MDYILAIDQGTTGTTSILMDSRLNRVSEASQDFQQYFPQPGWVEHDLNDIWATVVQTIQEATGKIDANKIIAIGITNQRETICFWDRKTLDPLGRAIVWQDRRSAEICAQLKAEGLEPLFQESTGLLLDPYFSGSKVAWAFENWPAVQTAYRAGRLALGTIDSFLLARLSNGAVYATEPSNASRTLCFHLTQHHFHPDLCTALKIPKDVWPEVRPSVGKFGVTRGVPGLVDGIPITGILGDQQSALLGQACVATGSAKCTYGTGAFLLMNTGEQPVRSAHRLLSTVAWALSEDQYTYALEGSAFVAGAAVQWIRDGLNWIQTSAEIETLAGSVPSSEGVTFVPALTGLGAPHWQPHATGLFTGMTRGTTRAHMARAVLEGIALQNVDILEAMQNDLGKPLSSLNVDGGACVNNLLVQFQADVLGLKLRRPKYLETTGLGAVFAAGLGSGVWTQLEDVARSWQEDRSFTPQIAPSERKLVLERWKLAVARSIHF